MTSEFNQSIYDASVTALTSNGVPEDVAERASEVVAKDDPTQENLGRSEEHTSELQSRPHISYAVFCLKKKKKQKPITPQLVIFDLKEKHIASR